MTDHEAQYVVAFDYRADDGPPLVGPFPSREAAWQWVSALGVDSESETQPLAAP